MIIKSLKQHFPARFPEWLNAGILAAWGAFVILHPQLFTDPKLVACFEGMVAMSTPFGPPAAVWGLSALFVGVSRGAALLVNGLYLRTPIIRLISSFCSAFIWTQVVLGLLKTGLPMPGIIVYAGLVFADICSAFRAGMDVTYAEKTRRQLREMKDRASDTLSS